MQKLVHCLKNNNGFITAHVLVRCVTGNVCGWCVSAGDQITMYISVEVWRVVNLGQFFSDAIYAVMVLLHKV